MSVCRSVACECGQKKGPKGYWDIVGTDTFEEAYALLAGYTSEEANELPAVSAAKRQWEEGSYHHPCRYYVHPDIPPKKGKVLDPAVLKTWSSETSPQPSSVSFAPSTLPSSSHGSTLVASTNSSSTTAPLRRETSAARSAIHTPIPPPSSSPARSRGGIPSNRTSPRTNVGPDWQPFVLEGLSNLRVAADPLPAFERSERSAKSLTNDMKHVLRLMFRLTKRDFANIDALLAVPGRHANLKSILLRSGMSDEEADVIGSWILGDLPVFDWENLDEEE